jgi:2-dehydropantoate 2-reductase
MSPTNAKPGAAGAADKIPTLIVGTGAMACLFAARLSAAGLPVTMLGSWPAGLQALAQNGVSLVNSDGDEQAYQVRVTNDPRACFGMRYALVLVKSWQTGRAAQQLSECLAGDGLALTLQNGMGNREQLIQALGVKRVAQGVTTIGATLLGPGRVRSAGEAVISLGAYPNVGPLLNVLQMAGFVIETVSDTAALLWGKLVINAAINPLTALLNVPNGALLERGPAHALLQAVVREAAAVAVAEGIRLPFPDPVVATETIARSTATNYSSMLQDVQRRAPTEINAICGAIVQAGERTGVPTPIIRTLWQLVKALLPG